MSSHQPFRRSVEVAKISNAKGVVKKGWGEKDKGECLSLRTGGLKGHLFKQQNNPSSKNIKMPQSGIEGFF